MGAARVLISTQTIGSGGATDITFSSIPQTYTDLVIKVSSRAAGGGAINSNIQFEFNGSTTSKTYREMYGTGTATGSASLSEMRFGYISGSTATASAFGNSELYIPNYTSSNYKSSSADSVSESNDAGAFMSLGTNLWSNTAAITSIKIFIPSYDLVQYSTASLYGINKS